MAIIHIKQALEKIEVELAYNPSATFSIDFVKNDGSLGHIGKARKLTKTPSSKESAPTSGFKYNLKEKQTILLEDTEVHGKKIRAIKIPLIIKFNGSTVHH